MDVSGQDGGKALGEIFPLDDIWRIFECVILRADFGSFNDVVHAKQCYITLYLPVAGLIDEGLEMVSDPIPAIGKPAQGDRSASGLKEEGPWFVEDMDVWVPDEQGIRDP